MTKEQEIAHVFKNRELILASKKNTIKHGDVVLNKVHSTEQRTEAGKAEVFVSVSDPTALKAKLVINTTGLIDSHMDCHIPGLWNKSLKELGLFHLLQEHEMDFDKVIADSINDGLKASAVDMPWSSLGYDYAGSTQALIFETNISKDRNTFMFDQYRKGYVLNHSVGMRYVKYYLCIDSEEASYAAEKENFDKYIKYVANKEIVEQKGYFYAVTEAKVIEGSAVVKGSNFATPTLSLEEKEEINNIEAVADTSTNEPSADTQKTTSKLFNY